MRTVRLVPVVALMWFFCGCGGVRETASVPREETSPFPELDPYGAWIDYPELGRVWQPRVAYDWQPFSEGRWLWTDQGWLWYSDEPFGWIVYHYGYWVNEGAAGWLWVPAYEWSPARVRWIVREDMIAWSPMLPPGRTYPASFEEHSWITSPPRTFVQRTVGRYRGQQPPPQRDPRGQAGMQLPPDVVVIERETNSPVLKERVDTEPVKRGDRQLLRIRLPRGRADVQPTEQNPPPSVTPVSPASPPVKKGPEPAGVQLSGKVSGVPRTNHPPVPRGQKDKKPPPEAKEGTRKPGPPKEPKQKKPDNERKNGKTDVRPQKGEKGEQSPPTGK